MRRIVRLLLLCAFAGAVVVAAVALARLGADEMTAWATVAAALAVIAAVLSAWSGQRVLELQEDALEPSLVPLIDLRSRYQLAQFRISNEGQSAAYHVSIQWERQLRAADGSEVKFAVDAPILVIPSGKTASVAVGGATDLIRNQADTTYRGILTFQNASGRIRSVPFVVSAEYERKALLYDEERPRTEQELQKLPGELRRISDALSSAVEHEASNRGMKLRRSEPIGPSQLILLLGSMPSKRVSRQEPRWT